CEVAQQQRPPDACTAQQQALWDMGLFYAQVTGGSLTSAKTLTAQDSSGSSIGTLPGGQASILCDSPFPTATAGKCLVTIYWDPGRTGTTSSTKYSCNASDSTALKCFQLSVILP
ncbi:MAG: hypothetical protein OSA97_13570, partial [Nevskia sp.]|nr:hypothetical protein [Nevskia sp.]